MELGNDVQAVRALRLNGEEDASHDWPPTTARYEDGVFHAWRRETELPSAECQASPALSTGVSIAAQSSEPIRNSSHIAHHTKKKFTYIKRASYDL